MSDGPVFGHMKRKVLSGSPFSDGFKEAMGVREPYRPASSVGEFCSCGEEAYHKVEEVIFDDDPVPMRHPLTTYLCRACFRALMTGRQAAAWKPIGTAPKDGTEFMGWVERSDGLACGVEGWWEPRCRYNEDGDLTIYGRMDYDLDGFDFYPHLRVTRWMPQPTTPE